MKTHTVHPLGNTLLRTPETWERYQSPARPKLKADDCFICDAHADGGFGWPHWRLIQNDYPYDAVAEKHVLLVPRRHTSDAHWLDEDEKTSLEGIKMELEQEGKYDAIIENLPRGRTHHTHYHLHVIQWKRQ